MGKKKRVKKKASERSPEHKMRITYGSIINHIRKASLHYWVRNDFVKKVKFKKPIGVFKNGNTKYGLFFNCEACKEDYDIKELEVDHIDPVGPFKGDWNDYIKRVFCDITNFRALCPGCHDGKTHLKGADDL